MSLNRVFPEFFRDASRAFALLEEPMFNVARRNAFPSMQSLMRYPATDIRETKEAYILEAELPGIRKEDVDIEFQDNTLVLRGKMERSSHHQSDNVQASAATPESTATSTEVTNSETGETSVVTKEDTDKDLTPHWWSNERITGSFSRSFSFPASVQSDAIKAAYKDGVLSIIIPKAEKASSKINIE
ncbi:HSP20-like chaperone [Umbelopsis sp. PMI_123]|jgi:HSP20 family protein|nr:HSP20-like chaperone [Umbelopsis sp. PMI_123]